MGSTGVVEIDFEWNSKFERTKRSNSVLDFEKTSKLRDIFDFEFCFCLKLTFLVVVVVVVVGYP